VAKRLTLVAAFTIQKHFIMCCAHAMQRSDLYDATSKRSGVHATRLWMVCMRLLNSSPLLDQTLLILCRGGQEHAVLRGVRSGHAELARHLRRAFLDGPQRSSHRNVAIGSQHFIRLHVACAGITWSCMRLRRASLATCKHLAFGHLICVSH
jgi:hypothetical protein